MFQNLGIWQRFSPDFCQALPSPEKSALLDIGGFFGRVKSWDKIEAKNQILEYFGYEERYSLEEKKRSKEEDLDIVKRAILQSRSNPMNVQITNAEVKKKVEKDHDQEARETYARQFEQGYLALIEEITNHAVDGQYSGETDIKPLPVEDFKIAPDKMKAIKMILKEEADGSIGQISNLSADVQLFLYEKGISFYDQALHEKAINSFIFLTTVNPNVQSFWIALALGYEKNLNFTKAIECLEAAIQCEPADFEPYYGILRCSEALKDYTKLKELLEAAIANPAHKEEASDLLEYLQTNS